MEERTGRRVHGVSFEDRTNGMITGVSDVLSFDAQEVILETEQGILMIKGQDLHVTRLTVEKGEVEIDGRIDSLTYSEASGAKKSAESFLGRLFK